MKPSRQSLAILSCLAEAGQNLSFTNERGYAVDITLTAADILYAVYELEEALAVLRTGVPWSDPLVVQSGGDESAVDRFAAAMKRKLLVKAVEGRSGWDNPVDCPPGRLQRMLVEHIPKGDPVDVGNFAMMLYCRKESTAVSDAIDVGPVEDLHGRLTAGGDEPDDAYDYAVFTAEDRVSRLIALERLVPGMSMAFDATGPFREVTQADVNRAAAFILRARMMSGDTSENALDFLDTFVGVSWHDAVARLRAKLEATSLWDVVSEGIPDPYSWEVTWSAIYGPEAARPGFPGVLRKECGATPPAGFLTVAECDCYSLNLDSFERGRLYDAICKHELHAGDKIWLNVARPATLAGTINTELLEMLLVNATDHGVVLLEDARQVAASRLDAVKAALAGIPLADESGFSIDVDKTIEYVITPADEEAATGKVGAVVPPVPTTPATATCYSWDGQTWHRGCYAAVVQGQGKASVGKTVWLGRVGYLFASDLFEGADLMDAVRLNLRRLMGSARYDADPIPPLSDDVMGTLNDAVFGWLTDNNIPGNRFAVCGATPVVVTEEDWRRYGRER